MSDATTYFVSMAVVFLIIIGLMYLCNGLRVLSPHNRIKTRVVGRTVHPSIFVMQRAPNLANNSARNNNEAHRIDIPTVFVETPQIHGNTPPPTYLESNGSPSAPAFCPPPSYSEATRTNAY